ncbi:outer membrane protein assembly factor BamB family protein [Kribbella sp. CA-293567]|uniref:outer membrane protein assembly factor BamB family protein n=1 Tax=Kribbella sp. CA-293567 TaxID=3002436 RepID=UPI003FA5AEF0
MRRWLVCSGMILFLLGGGVATSTAEAHVIATAGYSTVTQDGDQVSYLLSLRVDRGRWSDLRSTGEFTWYAALPAGLKKPIGPHLVEVEVEDEDGARWTATSDFTFTADKAIVPVAGADWSQHHGDAAHAGVAGDAVEAGQRLAWSYRTKGTFLTGSPAIVDGVVYAGSRDENGEGNSAVHAVSQATGQVLWTYQVPSSVHGSIVIAYDLATGKKLWTGTDTLGGWQDGIPSAGGGKVFIGSNNGIVARDGATGAVLWSYTSSHPSLVNGGATPSAAAIKGNTVYMSFPSGAVVALNATTGAVIWDQLLPGSTYRVGLSPHRPCRGTHCSWAPTAVASTRSTPVLASRCGSRTSVPGWLRAPRSAATLWWWERWTAISTLSPRAVRRQRGGRW